MKRREGAAAWTKVDTWTKRGKGFSVTIKRTDGTKNGRFNNSWFVYALLAESCWAYKLEAGDLPMHGFALLWEETVNGSRLRRHGCDYVHEYDQYESWSGPDPEPDVLSDADELFAFIEAGEQEES